MFNVFLQIWDWLGRNAETLIALAALFTVIFEVRSSRRHNRLSVRPEIMQYSDANENDLTFCLGVENCGLGPARILSCVLEHRGHPLPGNTPPAVRAHIEQIVDKASNRITTELIHPCYIIANGEKREVLAVELRDITQEQARAIFGELRNLDVRVKFESLYGEPDELRSSASGSG